MYISYMMVAAIVVGGSSGVDSVGGSDIGDSGDGGDSGGGFDSAGGDCGYGR